MSFFVLVLIGSVRADDIDVEFDPDGNLVMYTYDTAATTGIRYKTIGWTIKQTDAPIGETLSTRILLSETSAESIGSGTVRTRFETEAKTVIDAISAASEEWANTLLTDGGEVYLDAIMIVVRNGTVSGGMDASGNTWGEVYFTRSGIAGAEDWRDAAGLQSHFGKCVQYPPNHRYLEATLRISYYQVEEEDYENALSLALLGFDEEWELKKERYRIKAEDLSAEQLSFDCAIVRCTSFTGDVTTQTMKKNTVTVDNTEFAYQTVEIIFYFRAFEIEKSFDYQYGEAFVRSENRVILQAEEPLAPEFEVEDGIPTGEKLCYTATLQKYYFSLSVRRYIGKKFVPVIFRIYYYDDEGEEHVSSRTVSVPRDYSYYRITKLSLYTIDSGSLENGAMEPVISDFAGLPKVKVDYRVNRGSYVALPEETAEYWIDRDSYREGGMAYLREIAENVAEEVRVRNDAFALDLKDILDGDWTDTETAEVILPEGAELCSVTGRNLPIPHTRENRYFSSRAEAQYRKYQSNTTKTHEITQVGGVNVHTPVVCIAHVSDDVAHNQQEIPSAHPSFILGRDFEISMTHIGTHRDIEGYRTRDYAKYVARREVRFPFEVYRGGQHIDAGTWTIVGDTATFYLPIGVEEGDYIVEFRCYAANYEATANPREAQYANLKQRDYIAKNQMRVHISGRLYDLSITNVLDYPRWRGVFFDATGARTNARYRIGRLSMEGMALSDRTNDPYAPLLYGSNPTDRSAGPVGLGYRVTFELKTIGSMRDADDGILMLPTFYYMNRDGTGRTRVRLYGAKDLSEIKEIVQLTAQDRTFRLSYSRNVTEEAICERSIQIWSGDYQVSPDILIADAALDIDEYIASKGGRILKHDEAFLSGGYLIVRFEILSVNGGEVALSYANLENEAHGYCNMWRAQGFPYVRTDARGTQFALADGEFLLFDTKFSIYSDYESYGTH